MKNFFYSLQKTFVLKQQITKKFLQDHAPFLFQQKQLFHLTAITILLLGTGATILVTRNFTTIQEHAATLAISQSPTPTPSVQTTVTFNPASTVPFTHNVLGQAFVGLAIGRLVNSDGTNHYPFDPSLVPGLNVAMQTISPGVIRLGGVWANKVGWYNGTPPSNCVEYCNWPDPTNGPYYHKYYPALVDQLVKDAVNFGATTLILNINLSDNNPSMWQNMVSYVKQKKAGGDLNYNKITIYWELGNELDYVAPVQTQSQYASLFHSYVAALHDSILGDPSALIIGPTLANIQETLPDKSTTDNISPWFAAIANQDAVPALSMHWYQNPHTPPYSNSAIAGIMRWAIYSNGVPLSSTSKNNAYSRRYTNIFPGRIRSTLTNAITKNPKLILDETDVDGSVHDSLGDPFNGNYIGALWAADEIARTAWNTIDYVTRYDGYGTDNLAIVYPNGNSLSPTGVLLRPAYIPYLMYAKWFDQYMVPVTYTTSTDQDKISVWASKNSNTQTGGNEVRMMVTNMTNQPITMKTTINGLNSTQKMFGFYYQAVSSATTSTNVDFTATDSATVSINGAKIDPMNITASLPNSATFPDGSLTTNSVTYTYPAYSITSIKVWPNIPTPTPTPTTQITPTPTIKPTPTPTIKPTPTPTPTTITYKNAVLKDTPVAYYRLDDTSNPALNIGSATNVNGTYTGGFSLSQSGATSDGDTSASFNGSTRYVDIPYNSTSLNTTKFSIEAWAYPTGAFPTPPAPYRAVVGSRHTTSTGTVQGWTIYLDNNNDWAFWIWDGSGAVHKVTGPAATLNQWTYLAATFDPTTTTATLYINGTKYTSTTVSSYTPNSAGDEAIGQGELGKNYWFPGRIDEVAFYNYALSATQVSNHYTNK